MPLRVVRRKSTGALTISGTIRLTSGARLRVQQRARSNDPRLAEEETRILEAEILRTDWHGERRGARSFAAAVKSYLDTQSRRENEKRRLQRLLLALGDVRLSEVDQDAVTRLRESMLRPEAKPGTIAREITTPINAILRHANKRGWCEIPAIEAPRPSQGRTAFMMPDEAERLIVAASDHIKPLLVFLISTGARMSEGLYLEWRDVDLAGGRAIFWADRTKSGRRRNAEIPPRAVIAIANLPHRDGMIFRRPDGRPYEDTAGRYGGQIKTAWRGAIRRAGLRDELTPHACRHTWASWHYALHKDLLRLKMEGGWSTTAMIERYAHLMNEGYQNDIRRFLGLPASDEAVTGSLLHRSTI
jgi:integrase